MKHQVKNTKVTYQRIKKREYGKSVQDRSPVLYAEVPYLDNTITILFKINGNKAMDRLTI